METAPIPKTAVSPTPSDRALERSTLSVAAFTAFIGPFMASAVNVALPAIQVDFNINAVVLSWIATAYLLSTSVLLVPVGKLSDIFGRKKLFALGLWVLMATTALSAVAPNVAFLIAVRVGQGFSAAMVATTGMAILTSVFPMARRGRAIGVYVASVYVGLSIGPTVGGFLTQHYGWRSIFVTILPLTATALFVTLRYLRQEWRGEEQARFDMTGALLYAVALVSLIYGATLLPRGYALGLIAMGITGLVVFFIREKNDPSPLFDVRLFLDNRVFAFSSMASLINYAATFAVTFMMSLYLQYIKGLTPQTAGMVLITQPLVQACLSPVAGRLSDRFEPRLLASGGMALTAVGLIQLSFLGQDTELVTIVSMLFTLGLGFSLFSSPNMNAIMSSVEKRFYGVASGAVATMRLMGQMLSMAITTVVFALMMGGGQITQTSHPLFLASMKTISIIFTLLCVTGIFFSISRGSLRPQ